jgi:hypothetical protein
MSHRGHRELREEKEKRTDDYESLSFVLFLQESVVLCALCVLCGKELLASSLSYQMRL